MIQIHTITHPKDKHQGVPNLEEVRVPNTMINSFVTPGVRAWDATGRS